MDRSAQPSIHRILDLSALLNELPPDFIAAEPQIISARSLAGFTERQPFDDGLPPFSPHRPLIVVGIQNPIDAAGVERALRQMFAAGHAVELLTATGGPCTIRLDELSQQSFAMPIHAAIDPVASLAESRSPLGLHALTAILRSPSGCPWDREQTHASIRSAVIEEAFEVADAIDEGDPEHLAEELGDLALQVALHAQIALEAGDFTPAEVYGHINRKLVRRHPHVFADADAETPDDVLRTWEAVKANERAISGKPSRPDDPFDRLPRSMPVLNRVASILTDESRSVPLSGQDEEAIGDQLLELVERLVAANSNPEAVLERAYRRRTAVARANS